MKRPTGESGKDPRGGRAGAWTRAGIRQTDTGGRRPERKTADSPKSGPDQLQRAAAAAARLGARQVPPFDPVAPADKAAYFPRVFESAPVAMVLLDRIGRVLASNAEFTRLFGHAPSELVGRRVTQLIASAGAGEAHDRLIRTAARTAHSEIETVCRNKDGRPFPVLVAASATQGPGQQRAVCCVYRDITRQKRREAALCRLSTKDSLTGLHNRRGFFRFAEQQAKLASRTGHDLLLLYLDLDDLKRINDTYGHAEGDRVLSEIARLLRRVYRGSDLIARLRGKSGVLARMGGDEFVVLATVGRAEREDTLTARLHDELARYNRSHGRPYRVSLSVGVARFRPDDRVSIRKMLAEADRRMYAQKAERPDGSAAS